MSKSTHQIAVKGVDQTAAAFNSIRGRAAVTGAQIRKMVGGALSAAGAYLGFRAIKGGIDQLGHLSDIAQKCGSSVDDLTRSANAFSALGIQNMGVDQIGKLFSYMQRANGRTGMEGFKETMAELADIPDSAQRAQQAMTTFGRSGMELLPLINGGKEAVAALDNVIAAMPGVPQAAANAGDAISDAMGFATKQFSSLWMQGIIYVAKLFGGDFEGSVRESMLQLCNSVEYYTKRVVSGIETFLKVLSTRVQRYVYFWTELYANIADRGMDLGDALSAAGAAFNDYADDMEKQEQDILATHEERTKRWKESYDARLEAIKEFQGNYDKISGKRGVAAVEKEISRKVRIRNELVLGGSNQANLLTVIGPQFQSESKKQTAILEKIANNTEKTAENTEEDNTAKVEVIDK